MILHFGPERIMHQRQKILHPRVKRTMLRPEALVPHAHQLVEMVFDDLFEVIRVAARAGSIVISRMPSTT